MKSPIVFVLALGSLGWGQICALPQPSCSSSDPAMCQKLWDEYLENCGEHWLKPSTPLLTETVPTVQLPTCHKIGSNQICRGIDSEWIFIAPCSRAGVGEVCVKDEPKPLPTDPLCALRNTCWKNYPSVAEPVDVPAIKVGGHMGCEAGAGLCMDHMIDDYSCKDTSRFLLEAEDHTWHCLKFGSTKQ